jgi:Flp pilus assembly protein TadD
MLKRSSFPLDTAMAELAQSDLVDFYINQGSALYQRRHFAAAERSYRRALELNPRDADAYYNLGNVLMQQENLAEASACFQQAVRLNPNHGAAHFNLGNAGADQGNLEFAVESYRRCLQVNPNHAEAHNNLGNALQVLGQVPEAGVSYEAALRLNPRFALAQLNRGHWRLLQGDFELGWSDYEQRWAAFGKMPRYLGQPRWDGASLEGKTILVWAEQGLGDTLQFVRYLPMVKQLCSNVVLECQEALVDILTGVSGADHAAAAGTPLPPFDVQIPLLSLPGSFGTKMDTIPADVPYIPLGRATRRKPTGDRVPRTIGIVWQGSMNQKADRRSMPLAHFEPVAKLDGVQLVSLQVGPGAKQIAEASFPIADWGSTFNPASLKDLATAILKVDLVMTVDTAAAHLAGALGVPVWTLLSFGPDWRWLLHRVDCPWYPTMRLFRQTKLGDWRDVVERVVAAVGAAGSANRG